MPITRAFDELPGVEKIQEIEGPVIVEEAAGGGIVGARVGVVCAIGETLKGDADKPVEITNSSDFLDIFGGFSKFVGDGESAAHPYDGNLFMALSGHRFSRLIVVSVDTQVGTIDMSRTAPGKATMQSTNAGPYALADTDTFTVTTELGADGTATIQAEATSQECANAETYDFTDPADRVLTLQVNGGPLQSYTLTTPGDIAVIGAATAIEIRDAINTNFTGISATVTSGGTKVTVTTDRQGLSASLLFGGTARAVLGFPSTLVAANPANNNVQDVAAVTTDEMVALLDAQLTDSTPSNVGGFLRIERVLEGPAGTLTLSGSIPGIDPAGKIMFATTLGPVAGGTGTAPAATMFAGLRVSDGGANVFMLAEDAVWDEGALTKTGVKIKQVSGGTVALDAITTFVDTPDASDFPNAAITGNPATTALPTTESGWLTKYQAAIDAMKADKSPEKDANLMLVARHGVEGVAIGSLTGSIAKALTDHCILMTSRGAPRVAIVSPPNGTAKATARGASGIGVSSTTMGGRHKRRWYGWPGYQKQVQEVVLDDPTLDGLVDWPADVLIASKASLLQPELSLSQPGNELRAMLALESFYQPGGGGGALETTDYISNKAAGICSPRIDDVNGAILQSQVTSVDPNTDPADVAMSDRRARDWLHVSLVNGVARKQSKLNTPSRRRAVIGDIHAFLLGLQEQERIADFKVREATPASMQGKGILVILVAVRLADHLDNIVFRFNIGRTVDVEAVQ